jgi:hypothetical protein
VEAVRFEPLASVGLSTPQRNRGRFDVPPSARRPRVALGIVPGGDPKPGKFSAVPVQGGRMTPANASLTGASSTEAVSPERHKPPQIVHPSSPGRPFRHRPAHPTWKATKAVLVRQCGALRANSPPIPTRRDRPQRSTRLSARLPRPAPGPGRPRRGRPSVGAQPGRFREIAALHGIIACAR